MQQVCPMENGPFEDVFPIENEIFHGYVSLPEGILLGTGLFSGAKC